MHLLSHPPISSGVLKKIHSLPPGAAVPVSFDLSCPPADLPLIPPLFKPILAAPPAAAADAASADAAAVSAVPAAAAVAGPSAAHVAADPPAAAAAAAAGGGGDGTVPFWFDVVDIDPYGSCSPFLDAALGLLRSGGLLCVTSTDTSTLVGNAMETAFYKYGGATAKLSPHHEVAVR